MTLVKTQDILSQASGSRVGVAAFNVITLEYAEAIVSGAEEAGTSVILQVSENAVRFHEGHVMPIARACAALAERSKVPISLHLDHVEAESLLWQAAEAGFSSVMFDASRLSYDENVRRTRAAAEWAHSRGLLLEAELGEVGGKKGAHEPGTLTDPEEARAYVEATDVDALAVAVGSSHAMVERKAVLNHDLIARLCDAVEVPLVLHGSSGVPESDIRQAIEAGMVKINIGTALNVAFTAQVRSQLASDSHSTDPRHYLSEARSDVSEVVRQLCGLIAPKRLAPVEHSSPNGLEP